MTRRCEEAHARTDPTRGPGSRSAEDANRWGACDARGELVAAINYYFGAAVTPDKVFQVVGTVFDVARARGLCDRRAAREGAMADDPMAADPADTAAPCR